MSDNNETFNIANSTQHTLQTRSNLRNHPQNFLQHSSYQHQTTPLNTQQRHRQIFNNIKEPISKFSPLPPLFINSEINKKKSSNVAPLIELIGSDDDDNSNNNNNNNNNNNKEKDVNSQLQHQYANSAPLVSLISPLVSPVLSITHNFSLRNSKPKNQPHFATNKLPRIKKSQPLHTPREVPWEYRLLKTRRHAALIISRWWRSRELRAQERLIYAIKNIQRIGRAYLVNRRLQRVTTIRKDQCVSFAKSVRFCDTISAQLNAFFGTSIDRLPTEGWGLSLYDVDDQFDRSKSIYNKSRINVSKNLIPNNNVSFQGFEQSIRGKKTVHFDFGDAPLAVSQAAKEGSPILSLFEDNKKNEIIENEVLPEVIEIFPNSITSFKRPKRQFSLFSYKEEDIQNEETPNEALCCILNCRTSLKPLSVKVARRPIFINYSDLGPWKSNLARRSTVARVCHESFSI